MHKPDPTQPFWQIAETLLEEPAISKGTLMGFPCLRVDNKFFATADHRSGALIIKLSAQRVAELIQQGQGAPFAPAGRVFTQWLSVAEYNQALWMQLLGEAMEFVRQS